jgi:hypothetical protein
MVRRGAFSSFVVFDVSVFFALGFVSAAEPNEAIRETRRAIATTSIRFDDMRKILLC